MFAIASGVLIGLGAFAADGLQGPVGAVVLGIVSSASTWILAASVVGYFARTARQAAIAGALVMICVTTVYYTLRWFMLQPWTLLTTDGGNSAFDFLRVALVWIVGTAVGGALVGAFTFWLGRKIRAGSVLASTVWFVGCTFPAIAGMPTQVTRIIQGGAESIDWAAFADSSPALGLISSLTSALVVLLVLTWITRFMVLSRSTRVIATATGVVASLLLALVFSAAVPALRGLLHL